MKESNRVNNRDQSLDIAKGILLIAVILRHTYVKVIPEYIISATMPMFFIISGWLLKIPEKKDVKKWFVKRVSRLLLPYFVYGVIYGSLLCFGNLNEFGVYLLRLLYGGRAAIGVFWFVTVLLISMIVIVIIESSIHNLAIKIFLYFTMYCLAISESVLFIPRDIEAIPKYLQFPWGIDICLITIPYMVIGYYLHNRLKISTEIALNKFFCVMSLILTTIMYVLLYVFHANDWFSIDLKFGQYRNPLLDIVVPIMAGTVVLIVSKWLSGIKIGVIFSYVGQRSLIVMYVHLMIRDFIVIPIFGEAYSIFVYFFMAIMGSLLFDFIMKRIPHSDKFFGTVCLK